MVGGIVEVDSLPTMSTAGTRETGAPEEGRSPAEQLAVARQQFVGAIERGLGGKAAHARFADRIDGLIGHVVGLAPAPRTRLAVAALGGYGRRSLCLHSDVDLLIVFDGRIGARRGAVRQVGPPPAVGSQVDRGSPGAIRRTS